MYMHLDATGNQAAMNPCSQSTKSKHTRINSLGWLLDGCAAQAQSSKLSHLATHLLTSHASTLAIYTAFALLLLGHPLYYVPQVFSSKSDPQGWNRVRTVVSKSIKRRSVKLWRRTHSHQFIFKTSK